MHSLLVIIQFIVSLLSTCKTAPFRANYKQARKPICIFRLDKALVYASACNGEHVFLGLLSLQYSPEIKFCFSASMTSRYLASDTHLPSRTLLKIYLFLISYLWYVLPDLFPDMLLVISEKNNSIMFTVYLKNCDTFVYQNFHEFQPTYTNLSSLEIYVCRQKKYEFLISCSM